MIKNPNNQGHASKMIVICSAKGGIGRTVLSVNLAVALSNKKYKTTLLDACFQFGNIHLVMDLQPMFTIKDAVEQIDTLDENLLTSYLSHHESGVSLLSSPHKPEYADLITIHALDQICTLLLKGSDYLVVDTNAGLPDHNLYFMERADHILVMTDLEMTSLKNTKSILAVLDTLGLRAKVKIVVNRSTMKSLLQPKNIPQILEETSLLYIPNHFEVVSKSINIGVPFITYSRRTDITKSIFHIADLLSKDS
ncbi:AAA family ATPase [Marinisporobacter balticus]|uniref:Pilus assembly protein CpaE n=1 Tax=Marinisporobacter balticus TaxID=2018667 RepID=A0A4R2KXL9_9FIRM|nr:P-loop NTPase [Marinisporobacter balticus]TCO78683.1 pilus assembly protein CpaE [Marinisporobacter balticus]